MKRLAAVILPLAVLLAACGATGEQRPTIRVHGSSRYAAIRYGTAAAPTVGEVLTTTNGTWTNTPTGYTYQWQDCNGSCTNIAGATASSYTIQSSDLGDTIDVIVTASNAGGSASQTSSPTGTVTSGGGTAPSNTVQPFFAASTVSGGSCTAGCAIQGQTISVGTGTWTNSPTSFSYQWQDCTTTGGQPPTTAGCSNATGTGATSSAYTVAAGDVGSALAVKVTATNAGGSTPTTVAGGCNQAFLGASGGVSAGVPGCSPITAVAGASQTGERFCTNAPVTCGFADVSNAGIPAGTTLFRVPQDITAPTAATGSGWSYSGGNINFTTGAVLKNIVWAGSLDVSGTNNVTIENSDITCTGSTSPLDAGIDVRSVTGTIIASNNIHGASATPGASCSSAIIDINGDSNNTTVENNNIWYASADVNNFSSAGGLFEQNYMHDFGQATTDSSSHLDGIQPQASGSSATQTIRDNTILMNDSETSPIILSQDNCSGGSGTCAENGRTITHNLLGGGDYCFYAKASAGATSSTNVAFTSNLFTRAFYAQCGSQGFPDTNWDAATGDSWTANAWDDTGSSAGP